MFSYLSWGNEDLSFLGIRFKQDIKLAQGVAVTGAILIRVACVATEGHRDIRLGAAARGHVWVHVLPAAVVCDDVYGPCCHRGS